MVGEQGPRSEPGRAVCKTGSESHHHLRGSLTSKPSGSGERDLGVN